MLADLPTLKNFLRQFPGAAPSDALLTWFLQDADRVIKLRCKRDLETTTYPQDYYDGNNQEFLPLRQRPVQPNGLTVWLDPGGFYGDAPGAFGSTTAVGQTNPTLLTLGVDYALKRDQPDGSSKCGLLRKLGSGIVGGAMSWPWDWQMRKGTLTARLPPGWPGGAGNIKVAYTAGYGYGAPATFTADSNGNPVLTGKLPAQTTLPFELTALCCKVAAWIRQNTPVGTPVGSDRPINSVLQQLAGGKSPSDAGPMIGSIDGVLSHYREIAI